MMSTRSINETGPLRVRILVSAIAVRTPCENAAARMPPPENASAITVSSKWVSASRPAADASCWASASSGLLIGSLLMEAQPAAASANTRHANPRTAKLPEERPDPSIGVSTRPMSRTR